jgi:EAL domain-containing protein (putative c-di-GMP-specific phosphodiesterase class I)
MDAIEQAIRDSQLVLHYQPRIDLSEGTLAGVEALVRWQHPDKGLLYPDQFLPMIENTALEIALDEWVMSRAIAQHLRWREQGLLVPVSVNLCPQHIQQASFPEYLAELLSGYPEDLPRYLELEVLETSAISDTTHVADIMRACTELGVHFSLDDFGTGYSSLTYFSRLPIQVLKIDQDFVKAMLKDTRDQDIVEGVLHLARALNRPVVAEGVESLELGVMLMQLGCQYAQGYGVARPMLAEELVDWSRAWAQETDWHELHHHRHGPTPLYEINVAIVSHQLWFRRFQTCLESASGFGIIPADSACQFGQWAEGIGLARYGTRSLFGEILDKHAAIHQYVHGLLEQSSASSDMDEYKLEKLDRMTEELEAMLFQLAED